MADSSARDERLDRAFGALADPVRRALIARLSRGPATVNELAEPFAITLQAISRHVQVLEAAGLITRTRNGQQRPCHLDAAALEELTSWIDRYRLDAEQRHRRLDAVLESMHRNESANNRAKEKQR
jgi:DNA-binding transcriptional ArsR family regulator